MEKDYYKVLGVDRRAGDEDIKRAYRRLALRYHPDKNKAPDAEEKFKEINEAYGALTERKKHEVCYGSRFEGYWSADAEAVYSFNQSFTTDELRRLDEYFKNRRRSDPGSPFQQSCTGGTFQQAFRPGREYQENFGPGDTFEQTSVPGGTVKQTRRPGECFQETMDSICGSFQACFHFGSGSRPFCSSDTSSHGGTSSDYGPSGSSQDASPWLSERSSAAGDPSQRGPEGSVVQRDIFLTLEEVLHGCSKAVTIEWDVVGPDGHSVVRRDKRVIRINAKPGVASGTKVTYQCPGERTATYSPPAITFVIRDKEHPLFKRNGADIKYVAKLTPCQAQWSRAIDVPTLTLGNVSLPLEAPVTSRSIINIVGQGLPYYKPSKKRGDLIVTFQVDSATS